MIWIAMEVPPNISPLWRLLSQVSRVA